ncbi:MAG: BON domain-containing protein [Oligoflexia bacterium]|nr:BON domain-containing protein [Oligoflexia bacterium]
MLSTKNIFTFLILATFSLSIFAKDKVERITLDMGLTKEINVPNMPAQLGDDLNYNRNIVKISVAKELKLIRLEPIAAGSTNFTLRDSNGVKIVEYIIKVRKNNLNSVAAEIKNLLSDIEGIQIKQVNGRVVIDGEILLPKDMNRIYSTVSQFPDVATSMVTMSPLAQKKIAELIEKDIGNPEIHVRAVNEKFILEGVASNDAEKQKAEILAKTYVPDVIVESAEAAGIVKKRKIDSVINLLAVKPPAEQPPAKTIKLIVHYVELQKDYTKGFRFQWTPTMKDDSGVQFSAGGQNSSGGVLSTITGTINDLFPKLNFAKAHGHARVLKSSSLIVEDGNPGVIRSITRIPYSVQNQYGQLSTNFEEAGIDTNITPRIINAKSDSVGLTITFSLKSLIGQTEKGPLISNSTIQTRVTVRSTQSAAIGGLVGNDSSTAYNRLPKGASENPLLSLYASKQFQRNQSQFVVFVTPVILNSASDGADEVKKKFRLKQ